MNDPEVLELLRRIAANQERAFELQQELAERTRANLEHAERINAQSERLQQHGEGTVRFMRRVFLPILVVALAILVWKLLT